MSVAFQIAVGLVAGIVAGTLYFEGLWRTVRDLPGGAASALPSLARSFAGRSLALTVVMVMLVWWSVVALLGALVGFRVGRHIAVRRHRGADA